MEDDRLSSVSPGLPWQKGCKWRPDQSLRGLHAELARDVNSQSIRQIQFTTSRKEKELAMLYWALMFLIIAIVAAVLGFGGLAGTASWIANVLFVVFLVLFLVSLLTGMRRPVV